MDAEIKAKWVAALRSGKYQQGQARLRSRDGSKFCCLGVLCELLAPERWLPSEEYEMERHNTGFLPAYVSKPARLSYEQTFLLSMGMNDKGVSFEKIADYIEKNL